MMLNQAAAQQQLIAILDQVSALLTQGNHAQAELLINRALAAWPGQPDLVQLLGSARMQTGNAPEAEALYRRSLALKPKQPHVLLNLGHCLRAQRRPAEAVEAYRQAIKQKSDYADAHLALAVIQHEVLAFPEAERAYRNVLRLDPGHIGAKIGLGGVLNDQKRPDDAIPVLARALSEASDPLQVAVLEHNLGLAHTLKRDLDSALAHLDRAKTLAPDHHSIDHARGGILQTMGRDEEALDAFRAAVRLNPMNYGAHVDLNMLLYRHRRDEEFLRSYDEAASRFPKVANFLAGKASFLLRLDRAAEAEALYERVLALEPGHGGAMRSLAVACSRTGKLDRAIDLYEKVLAARPDDLNALTGIAPIYLIAREPKKAAAAAERALAIEPFEQSALAALGTAWRVMGDEREFELNGYDRFIREMELEPPEGYRDMDAFNRELNAYLDGMHPDGREFVDQSLRKGTQTVGDIFGAGHDLVERLRMRIEEAVARYIAELPQGAENHPLLSRRNGGFAFNGAWSSRLRDCGFHTDHVHPGGWISSAYYIALPGAVADAGQKQGWIKFGQPSYDAGLDDPVRRTIQPRTGKLVLFPSYMWHGTVPFQSDEARTTIAFDVVPQGGKP